MASGYQLSPWDQAPYFQPIKETLIPLSGLTQKSLCLADPQRIGLIFASAGTDDCYVSTIKDDSLRGFVVKSTMQPLVLLHKDVGPLIQVQWWGNSSGALGTLTVIEILLSKWPTLL